MAADRSAKISEGQRACLRMVLQHMSSKDIARALNISPHTVDQRLKLAMRTLEAATRVEAARTLAAMENEDGYQSSVHQRPDLAPGWDRSTNPASAFEVRRESDEFGGGEQPVSNPAFPSPPVQEKALEDDLGSRQRIGWTVLILAGTAVGFAALLVALLALSELTR